MQQVVLCPESRQLAVAGAAYVIHFRFSRTERNADVPVSRPRDGEEAGSR